MKIAILGRETSLCRAEIETIFSGVIHLDKNASLYEDDRNISIDRAGGIIKLGQVIAKKPLTEITTHPQLVENLLLKFLREQQFSRKISFGISVYGDEKKTASIASGKVGLELKKLLKKEAISCRYINAKNKYFLSAAQVTFNDLLGPKAKGFDFIYIITGGHLILGFTTAVQDINSYAWRDRQRPCRDMVVGMLPPKLAQIMINLANPAPGQTVYDPFCGSGVILQEALLADLMANGSDISSKMIRCSQKNLAWLKQNYPVDKSFNLIQADATKLNDVTKNSVIVSEGFLGQPLSTEVTEAAYRSSKNELVDLYINFFKNLGLLKNCPTKIVICLPVWRSKAKILTLEIIDQIRDLGYTLKQFDGQDSRDLIYIRDNQTVGRQVLVLIRKAI